MTYVPDAYEQWKKHDAEMEEALMKLPICSVCGEPIQTEYLYEIDDECICEDCMREHRRCVTDYIS